MAHQPTPCLRVAITCGDPAGIGLETLLKVAARPDFPRQAEWVLYGDPRTLERARNQFNLPPSPPWTPWTAGPSSPSAGLRLHPLSGPDTLPTPGRYDPAWGPLVRQALEQSFDHALRGWVDAVVTLPIDKAALSGTPSFSGQTELLADRCGAERYDMMLVAPGMRVVPVTRHLAIEQVSRHLSVEGVASTIELTARSLRESFAISEPLVAVCGLNPHAGDGGRFGDEEARVIAPAIEACRQRGIQAIGPLPADGLFSQPLEKWDAIIAMYHDQGLIPFKLLHGTIGVNTTLGVPVIRTSPDHGVAFDIAGSGRADERSTAAALELALTLAQTRREQSQTGPHTHPVTLA